MEDPAEIAALAQEFITSLDNLPQEVGHLVSEVSHKEEKIQDLLPRIANREAQVRDVLTKGGANLSNPGAILPETDRAKLEKLLEKVRADYDRVEELSRQKEILSLQLWREVHRHSTRLKSEMDRIAPSVLSAFTANDASLSMPVLAGLPAALSGLRATSDMDVSLKRKANAMLAGSPSVAGRTGSGSGTPKGWRGTTPTAEAAASGPMLGRSGSPAANALRGRKAVRAGGVGRSNSSLSGASGNAANAAARSSLPSMGLDEDMDTGGDMDLDLPMDELAAMAAAAAGGEDKETLYCHCQRVSFGEMIGCDAEDCKFEWFHIGCVGVSKPLPQTWYCDDCKERLGIGQKKKKVR